MLLCFKGEIYDLLETADMPFSDSSYSTKGKVEFQNSY